MIHRTRTMYYGLLNKREWISFLSPLALLNHTQMIPCAFHSHSLQNTPLQSVTRVKLILILDGDQLGPITGMGEAVLCVVQLLLSPSLLGFPLCLANVKKQAAFSQDRDNPCYHWNPEVNRRGGVVWEGSGGLKKEAHQVFNFYDTNSTGLRKYILGPQRQIEPGVHSNLTYFHNNAFLKMSPFKENSTPCLLPLLSPDSWERNSKCLQGPAGGLWVLSQVSSERRS